jgi:FtsZ-binding cell division protein ZapB
VLELMSPDWRRPGTTHEQIAEGRASFAKRLKDAKEAIGVCTILCSLSVLAARYVVQRAVRDELAEMKRTAEEARVQASGVTKLREDLTAHIKENAEHLGNIRGDIHSLGAEDMRLREADNKLQERIEALLSRGIR